VLAFESIVDAAVRRRREHDAGVMSLFEAATEAGAEPAHDERIAIPDQEFDKGPRLAFEKEMLGLYVSEHPMLSAERALRRHVDCTLTELKECREGELRTVGGIVTGLSRKYTKRGDLMATFTLEDLGAAIEVMVFPKTMTGFGHVLVDDAIVTVKARLDLRDDEAKLIAMEVAAPELVLDGGPPVRLRMRSNTLSGERVERLRQILREHPGDCPVFVHLDDGPSETTVLRLSDEHLVDSRNGLFAELRELLGANCIV